MGKECPRNNILTREASLSMYQDGAPSKRDGEALLHSLSMIARGNCEKEIHKEKKMNDVRHAVGLYRSYPLANDFLAGALKREMALKNRGSKQMNHVRGTDGWFRSMLVIEVRAFDNYLIPLIVVSLNALLATMLNELGGITISNELLSHWNNVFSMVMNTSLAFLLVFRLNRCALRFWEARGYWGNMTHLTRNLVSGILMYCGHSERDRDMAIRWGAAFCVASMHFIRSDNDCNLDELSGILTIDQSIKLRDAEHGPLYAASMIRYYLKRALDVHSATPPHLANAYAIQMNALEHFVTELVAQVSGMEKIRSTPLPVAYVTHLRTLLFLYCLLLPYVWVENWSWATLPLAVFTAFALFGIEGVSSEVEIPFDRRRPNHLALEAYCLVMLNSVQSLVVHEANLHMQCGERDVSHDKFGHDYNVDP